VNPIIRIDEPTGWIKRIDVGNADSLVIRTLWRLGCGVLGALRRAAAV